MQWRSFIAGVCALVCTPLWAQELQIGVLPAADSIVLYVASEEGLFKDAGLEVTLVPFKSALEIGAAMRAGRLDGHFGDLMNVFAQNETGAPQTVVLTTTHTCIQQRAFGLVTSPQKSTQLHTLLDLKDTKTAMSSATIIDYLLDRMKETEELSDDALINQEIRQIPIRLQMLLSNQIDTALLPEPLVTVAELAGGNVLWDDRDLNEALAVVALNKKVALGDTVAAFRRAIAKAAARIEDAPEHYRTLMIEKRLLPKKVASDYAMVRFSLFGRSNGLPPLPSALDVQRVGEWMVKHKMLKEIPKFSDVIYQD